MVALLLTGFLNRYLDGTPQAPSGAVNEGHLDYVGNGDSNSFWNHTPRAPPPLPDTLTLQTSSSLDLDEGILAE